MTGQRAFQQAGWKLVSLDGEIMLFNLSMDPFEEKDVSAEIPGRVAQLQSAWEVVEGGISHKKEVAQEKQENQNAKN